MVPDKAERSELRESDTSARPAVGVNMVQADKAQAGTEPVSTPQEQERTVRVGGTVRLGDTQD